MVLSARNLGEAATPDLLIFVELAIREQKQRATLFYRLLPIAVLQFLPLQVPP